MWFSFLLWNDKSTLPAQKLCSSYYILVLFVYYIRLIFHYYFFRFIVFLNKLVYVRTYIMEWILILIFPSCLFINIIVLDERWDLRLLLLLLDIYCYYLLRSDARQICHQSNGAMSCSHFRLRDFWKSVGVDAANKCEVVLSNTIIIKVGYYFFCLIISVIMSVPDAKHLS